MSDVLKEFASAYAPEEAAQEDVASSSNFHPEVGDNVRRNVLMTAETLVNGDRNVDYGDPIDDFRRTGTMWGAYLGVPIQPHDVAAMMGMLKLSRIRWSPTKMDNWIDLAGYAACGADCAVREDQ